ncbi:MAG: DUF5067 domain-containing protein [Ruminococcus sp.]|nr:DUF5067 domain-containing protein [Ruminococcus sp.]
MKNSKKSKLILALITAGIISSCAGCSGSSEEKVKTGDISSSSSESEKNDEKNSEEDNAEAGKYAGIGQFIEDDTWKISLLDAKTYGSLTDDSGFYTDEPDSGNEYLVMFFEVENVSGEDDYFNYFYIDAYADGYSTDIEIILNNPDGYDTLTGDVAAGKKLKGCLAWQVPENWSEFEMSYNDDFTSSNASAMFKITSEDAK